jgi:hypothetical protein
MNFIPRNDQAPQQAQPSAPQNDFRSVIDNRFDHAAGWLWPWTAHALTLLQVITMRC